jgi:hypothetical protein
MKIDIRCTSKDTLMLAEMTDFQGNLKERTDDDLRRIASSIEQYGFSFPFFVWRDKEKNLILDGHGRHTALQQLEENGFDIPPLPVVYINANSADEAKALLLQVNSIYGETSRDELLALIEEIGADIGDLSFPNINFDDSTGGDEYFAPELDPVIDTDEVSDRDIDRAAEKLADNSNEKEYHEFTCASCAGSIFIKKEVISRYLKGEHV